jgi:hypothetical protein
VEHALPKSHVTKANIRCPNAFPARRKTLSLKIKDGNPSSKGTRRRTSRHNQKKKQKQKINKNQVKTLCKEDS